jgi:hypothetical protein
MDANLGPPLAATTVAHPKHRSPQVMTVTSRPEAPICRYQTRYFGPDGLIDLARAKIHLKKYAESWIKERPNL